MFHSLWHNYGDSFFMFLVQTREISSKQPIFSMTSGEGQTCLPNFLISRMPSSNFCWSPPSALICPGLQRTITKSKLLQSSKNLHTVHANFGKPENSCGNWRGDIPFLCMMPAKKCWPTFLNCQHVSVGLWAPSWALDSRLYRFWPHKNRNMLAFIGAFRGSTDQVKSPETCHVLHGCSGSTGKTSQHWSCRSQLEWNHNDGHCYLKHQQKAGQTKCAHMSNVCTCYY